jgi:hypothetical protein
MVDLGTFLPAADSLDLPCIRPSGIKFEYSEVNVSMVKNLEAELRKAEAAAAEATRSKRSAEKKALRVLENADGFLSLVKLHNRVENMFRRLSDIEGGLRTLGPEADQPSVSRIRRATAEVLEDLIHCVDELVDLTASLAIEDGGTKTFIADIQAKLLTEMGGRRPRKKSSKSSD